MHAADVRPRERRVVVRLAEVEEALGEGLPDDGGLLRARRERSRRHAVARAPDGRDSGVRER
jgi:hypothetical protein